MIQTVVADSRYISYAVHSWIIAMFLSADTYVCQHQPKNGLRKKLHLLFVWSVPNVSFLEKELTEAWSAFEQHPASALAYCGKKCKKESWHFQFEI